MDQMKRMKELTDRLRKAAKVYYQEDRELMSNLEYDRLYDELCGLERGDRNHPIGKPYSEGGL